MADNTLFEVDAAQILAKLHLAGIQASALESNSTIINTGIVNDNPKARPDKPGNVAFNLNNPSNEYEVGYATWIEYHKSFDLDDILGRLQKFQADLSGDKSKIDDKSSDPKIKKSKAKLEEYKDKLRHMLGVADNVPLDTPEDIKNAKEAIKKFKSNDESDYVKVLADKKAIAIKTLTTYLNNFAGADNVDNSKIANAAMIPISENNALLTKQFEIQKAPDQEIEKLTAQFKANYSKNPSKKNCKQRVCFKVKYSLNIDK